MTPAAPGTMAARVLFASAASSSEWWESLPGTTGAGSCLWADSAHSAGAVARPVVHQLAGLREQRAAAGGRALLFGCLPAESVPSPRVHARPIACSPAAATAPAPQQEARHAQDALDRGDYSGRQAYAEAIGRLGEISIRCKTSCGRGRCGIAAQAAKPHRCDLPHRRHTRRSARCTPRPSGPCRCSSRPGDRRPLPRNCCAPSSLRPAFTLMSLSRASEKFAIAIVVLRWFGRHLFQRQG